MKYWYLFPITILTIIILIIGFVLNWNLLEFGIGFVGISVAGAFTYLLGSRRYGNTSSEISA
ncbi:hypothetical protein [Candidatus Lokiarchaeum ossiferum]|uniref:hypothetical protein n=1 Tax=Candidatus Lokiarchaeum ossiferum TaxID=2951803 RepID=UPI00352DFEC4